MQLLSARRSWRRGTVEPGTASREQRPQPSTEMRWTLAGSTSIHALQCKWMLPQCAQTGTACAHQWQRALPAPNTCVRVHAWTLDVALHASPKDGEAVGPVQQTACHACPRELAEVLVVQHVAWLAHLAQQVARLQQRALPQAVCTGRRCARARTGSNSRRNQAANGQDECDETTASQHASAPMCTARPGRLPAAPAEHPAHRYRHARRALHGTQCPCLRGPSSPSSSSPPSTMCSRAVTQKSLR